MTANAWGVLGVLVAQLGAIVLLLINRRTVKAVEHHVNNVEVDIDHDSEDVSIGQRLRRMERSMTASFVENDRVHHLIMDAIGDTAVDAFRRTFVFDPLPAYQLVVRDGDPPFHLEWVNQAWSDLTGLTLAEGQTGQYVAGIHPDDRDRVLASAADSIRNNEVLTLRYRIADRVVGGGWIEVELHGEPYASLDGTRRGQLGVLRIVRSTQ